MNNSAILSALKVLGIALFGAAVYEKKEVLFSNVQGKVERSQFGQDQLVIKDEQSGETAYIRLGRGVLANKPAYDIVKHVAIRAASGKNATGQPWSVPAGKVIALAM